MHRSVSIVPTALHIAQEVPQPAGDDDDDDEEEEEEDGHDDDENANDNTMFAMKFVFILDLAQEIPQPTDVTIKMLMRTSMFVKAITLLLT